jgi:ribonuclease BN (tRNA processing enzyme)
MSVETALRAQIAEPHFPVAIDRFAANVHFQPIVPGECITLPSGAQVTSIYGHHPGGVLIYRIDYKNTSLVYATDVEYEEALPHDLIEFARKTDMFIFDAMYTPEEYRGVGTHSSRGSRKGWGHSTYVAGAKIAEAAQVKQYILFHHDPNQNDASVSDKVEKARALFPLTQAAVEGLEISLEQAVK